MLWIPLHWIETVSLSLNGIKFEQELKIIEKGTVFEILNLTF